MACIAESWSPDRARRIAVDDKYKLRRGTVFGWPESNVATAWRRFERGL